MLLGKLPVLSQCDHTEFHDVTAQVWEGQKCVKKQEKGSQYAGKPQ